jgi:acetate---CoA ligase (ADP-forming)
MRTFTDDPLHRILNPRSVAIVGISRDPNSFGYPLVEIALRYGYAGSLYLVNPNADRILGLACYPSVLAIPAEVDTALIMVPKSLVLSCVEDCINKHVKGIVIITSGFAEEGLQGKRLQDEMLERANQGGIRIVGPNTLGYYSAPANLDLLMSGFIRKGRTALLTQSGNLTTSLTFPGAERGLGFSYVIDLGNQADLQFHDCVRYLRRDPFTKTLAIHIEGLRDGRKFMAEVQETVKTKPVFVLKSGRSEVGARIAASHTAAIAGNDRIYSAALRQCGAIQLENFTEFNSLLLAFSQEKTLAGNRMCIISEGGGDCALCSDACVERGLAVPKLSEATKRRLSRFVPQNGSIENPIDVAGWEYIFEATEIALQDDAIDGVIIVGGFAGFYHISPKELEKEKTSVLRMCALIAESKKPVAIYSYFSPKNGELVEILKSHDVPLFMDHHDAVQAMAAMLRYNGIKTKMARKSLCLMSDGLRKLADEGVGKKSAAYILEPDAKQMLARYHLPCPEERVARNQEEAAALGREIGYPVVLKIISRDIPHKSDAGCVRLGLHTQRGIKQAFRDIVRNARKYKEGAEITGVLVSKMDIEEGVEVIIGGLSDPVFGPVIMFGLGGVFVEAFEDVAFRVCPIDETDADEMIRETRGFPLLAGVRGKSPADIDSVKEALINVSNLLMENPHIRELDLNPVKVHKKGLVVLDARMIVS